MTNQNTLLSLTCQFNQISKVLAAYPVFIIAAMCCRIGYRLMTLLCWNKNFIFGAITFHVRWAQWPTKTPKQQPSRLVWCTCRNLGTHTYISPRSAKKPLGQMISSQQEVGHFEFSDHFFAICRRCTLTNSSYRLHLSLNLFRLSHFSISLH